MIAVTVLPPPAIGLDRATGRGLAGVLEHLRQSVSDILTTPLGTRVLRRDYGSRLPDLLGAPLNQGTVVDAVAATADALARWEPRLTVTRVEVTGADGAGQLALALSVRLRADIAREAGLSPHEAGSIRIEVTL
jgi:uncharacterized protein